MKYFVALLLFFLPAKFVRFICGCIRYKGLKVSGKNIKIGFSIIVSDNIELTDSSRIGHLNFIKCNKLSIGGGRINHLNFIRGAFSVNIAKGAWINNQNKISAIGDVYHEVSLVLKENAKIGVKHLLDMTDSIIIGENSMLAGADTQIWTHNFYFSKDSSKIAREDAPVVIGRNCYIGARCTIMAGVRISNAITVGAQCCVPKSLLKQGLYVSQGLRHIDFDPDKRIADLGMPVYKGFIFRRKNNVEEHIDS